MVAVPEVVVKRRLTFEDYEALPDDAWYEIIEGVLYVSPRPRPRHQVVAGQFAFALYRDVQERGLGTVILEADLIVDERNTYVAPDIMVFLGDRFAAVNLEQKITIIPDLIVEVLSPSNEDYDLTTKAQTYARLGVPHYWAVDPRRRALTEHVRQPAGEYSVRTVTAPEPFTPALFPELTLDLDRMLA